MAPRVAQPLLWTLSGTLLASGWALWGQADESAAHHPTPPTAPSRTPQPAARPAGNTASLPPQRAAVSAEPSPATERAATALGPATRDPFQAAPPPPPAPAPTPPEALAQREPPPPAPPAPPPMTHRVVGRFQSPQGERMVFVQDGADMVRAAPGVLLGSGYTVQAVDADVLRLSHPLAAQPLSLSLAGDAAP